MAGTTSNRARAVAAAATAAALAFTMAASGCSSPRDAGSAPTTLAVARSERPVAPELLLSAGEQEVQLRPYSTCRPDDHGPDPRCDTSRPDPDARALELAAHERLAVDLADANSELTATFTQSDGACPTTVTALPSRTGSGWTIEPPSDAGSYELTLSARGAFGDAAWSSRIVTDAPGAAPPPTGVLTWQAPAPAADLAVPLHVDLLNLTDEPARASARVTTTAANGSRLTTWLEGEPDGTPCWTGAISFGWPVPAAGLEQLGPAPYSFAATLWVDGHEVVLAPRTWPQDWPPGDHRSRPAPATKRKA